MKKIEREGGYSLVLTLLICTLFLLLGMTLIAATMGGFSRTEIREDKVQAEELSDKGLERITKEIQSDLENVLGVNGLPKAQFPGKLNEVLKKYECDGGSLKVNASQKTGDYNVCISNIEDIPNKELKKLVTFKSSGKVNKQDHVVYSTMEIGGEAPPDALNYAVGAHRTCTATGYCNPNEGHMFLHGAVQIEGDMKVDGNITTTNQGYASSGSTDYWVASLLPTVVKTADSKDVRAKLVLGGDVYNFSDKPRYSTHIGTTARGSVVTDNLQQAFADPPPQIVTREPKRDDIDISGKKNFYYYSKKDSNAYESCPSGINSDRKVYADCYGLIWGTYPVSLYQTSSIRQLSTAGDLEIYSKGSSTVKITINEGLYVGGNLSITGNVELEGPLYVEGSVKINNANAKLNALMYVNKGIEISNSTINGLKKNNGEGSLLVFANDKVRLVNNSVDSDTPSYIKGFFFSESDMEMFGTGSNVRIKGGISAKRIVLNAIRGSSSKRSFTGSSQYGSFHFQSRATQPGKPSRLQIIYDQEIIDTYADLQREEPIIKEVDQPQLKDRKLGP